MKIALHNLGCKVNAYETDAIREMLESAGYTMVSFKEVADIYIVNTCTVTNIADRKSRQMLHRAKKQNPQGLVVAMGCYVQTRLDSGSAIDLDIDIIIGNNKKRELLLAIEEYKKQRKKISTVVDITKEQKYEELKLSEVSEHTRAYIKVQDGCNQFCSYCIIPYARGRVRSRKKEDVINEIEKLSEKGCKEVVLTGIHLSSYGVDFKEKETLLSLIQNVAKVTGIKRIRLGSLEPRIIDVQFVKSLREIKEFCPHFHLSLQSGCDATLKRMNRKYTSEEYAQKCKLLRKYFDNPSITTDIIVGFPGETQEEFNVTYKFLQELKLYETHIFKYSKRVGTKAATMKEQVPEDKKKERSQQLIALAKDNQAMFEDEYQGLEVEILIEESVSIKGEKWWLGHTKEYIKVALKAPEDIKNQIITRKMNKDLQIVH